jgi:hypothetical protein
MFPGFDSQVSRQGNGILRHSHIPYRVLDMLRIPKFNDVSLTNGRIPRGRIQPGLASEMPSDNSHQDYFESDNLEK